jgi:hypothetical protein
MRGKQPFVRGRDPSIADFAWLVRSMYANTIALSNRPASG